MAAGREQRLVIVAELHESEPEPVENRDKADVILDAGGILGAEEDRGPALGFGAAHIGAGEAVEDQMRKSLEAAAPARDIGGRLAEALMIADGCLNGGHTALVHVAEDRFRPVAVLQTIDDEHGQHDSRGARAVKDWNGAPAYSGAGG